MAHIRVIGSAGNFRYFIEWSKATEETNKPKARQGGAAFLGAGLLIMEIQKSGLWL